jgi:chromosomal replication initiation ATPase DnaA
MLLYGPSGTRKSFIINAVCQQVRELAKKLARSES